jgi:hypothetical protein
MQQSRGGRLKSLVNFRRFSYADRDPARSCRIQISGT